ncbi:MAG: hypothetical protein ABIO57_01100 [Candidatus Paceibacterota bacterium]
MKKAYILILLTAFAFPSVGNAAISSTSLQATTAVKASVIETTDINSPLLQGKSLGAKKIAVQAALTDIYSQLTSLSMQTQIAINQLNANGIITTDAQIALIGANNSLIKSKNDITAFSTITVSSTRFSSFTLDIMKSTTNTAEISLHEAKTHLLDSLAALKASLPALDTDK